jgi:hypothetical protein
MPGRRIILDSDQFKLSRYDAMRDIENGATRNYSFVGTRHHQVDQGK